MSDLGFTLQRVKELLRKCQRDRASDVHCKSDQKPLVMIDRRFRDVDSVISKAELQAVHLAWLTDDEVESLRAGHFVYTTVDEDDLKVEVNGVKNGAIRLSAGIDENGPFADFRFQPAEPRDLRDFGLRKEVSEVWQRRIGLVLFVAPPGHGKTNLAHAYLHEINKKEARNMLTAEWPAEFPQRPIRSRISQHHIGRTGADPVEVAMSLRRRNQNVAYIAELFDLSWMRAALRAAQVALTFATIHGTQAPSAIEGFIEAFPEGERSQIRVWLAEHLSCVIGTRVVPRSDREGVVIATEFLDKRNNVRAHIIAGEYSGLNGDIQMGKQAGMHMLESSLADYVAAGIVSEADAREHVTRGDDLFQNELEAAKARRKASAPIGVAR